MVGFLVADLFVAVAFAYGCTEFLLQRLDPLGSRTLHVILLTHLLSFAILWIGNLALLVAVGMSYYLVATIASACAQAVWLSQHLWSYYRDPPRLSYEP